jgi:hypothetical protein
MYQDKFKPLPRIEVAHAGVFIAVFRLIVSNGLRNLIHPLTAFDEQVAGFFLSELKRGHFAGKLFGYFYLNRRETSEK